LPVDMRDWLPEDHLVWFVIDTVTALDTAGLERHRRLGGAGTAGYDPVMLLGLLVYAYCGGVRSSRRIEQLCHTDVAFRVLCAQQVPDHATIARFRAQCQDDFAGLFAQVLLVAAKVGLARFATIAIDGTKIPANASIDANRGAEWLAAQVQEMITEAAQLDQAEAAGQVRADDRVPAELVDRSVRAERIRPSSPNGTGASGTPPASSWPRPRLAASGPKPDRVWSDGSRQGRTGWPKPGPTWPARSLASKPHSLGGPRSSPQARSPWAPHPCRSSDIPT